MSEDASRRLGYAVLTLALFFGWLVGWYMGADAMEREHADRVAG